MTQGCPLRRAVSRCLALLPAGNSGVVAVSGGPDSVALVRALVMETSAQVSIAHLNHQLRGQESDSDEAFVGQLHSELVAAGATLLPLALKRIDVRAAASGDNLESVARRLRYDWFAEVARNTGASWVATGHTADDQAETVLHRLLRGTGLRGLAGIPRQRTLAPGITLVRPLLEVRRSEVLTFLQELGQSYRLDSSNQDRQYMRNRLRHDLLPQLEAKYNPGVVEVLCGLAEQAHEAGDVLKKQARELLAVAELPRAGAKVVLDTRRLAAEPPVLAAEALRLLWEREGCALGAMGFADWQRVIEVVRGEQSAVEVAGGIRVRRVGHVVQLELKKK